jgi:type IV pilus assembly protein PilQ
MRLKQTQAVFLLLAGFTLAGHASGSQLSDVSVAVKDASTTVVLLTNGPFTHNEYCFADNLLFVDLAGVSAGKWEGRTGKGNGSVVTSYHVLGNTGTGGGPITRVEVSLAGHCAFRPHPSPEGLTIEILSSPSPAQHPASAANTNAKPASASQSASLAKPPEPAQPANRAKTTSTNPAKEHGAKPVAVEKFSVVPGAGGSTTVEILASGPLNPQAMRLAGPDRIVVDLLGAVPKGQPQTVAVNARGVAAVRMARFQANPPITRVVVDLDGACDFELANHGTKLSVHLRPVSTVAPQPETSAERGAQGASPQPAVAETTPGNQPPAPSETSAATSADAAAMAHSIPAVLRPVVMEETSNPASPATGPAAPVASPVKESSTPPAQASAAALDPGRAALNISATTTGSAPDKPSALVSGASPAPVPAAAAAPATALASSATQASPTVAAPAASQPAASPASNREPEYRGDSRPAQEFVLAQANVQERISNQDPNRSPVSAQAKPVSPQPQSEGSNAAPTGSAAGVPQQAVNFAAEQRQQVPAPAGKPEYTGDPVSVNLKDVDLKDFFRLIHDISHLNIVLDPSVSGSLTLVLDDVPWDQALDIVLKNNGLDRELVGNVLRIATRETLRTEAEARRKQEEAQTLAVSKVTTTRFLSYAHAKDVLPAIKRLLSARGEIVADERTNGLIISDIPSVIPPIDKILAQLDRKTQEVEIEARVVAATRNFARDIGVQLGLGWGNGPTAVGGNAAAGTSPNQVGYLFPPAYITNPIVPVQTSSTSTTSTAASIPLFSNLAATTTTSGLSLLNIGNAYRVDAILSASEQRGLVKILSRPRIITQNNVLAVVKQGSRVPITTLGQLGGPATVTYVEAVLRLTVTPQITVENTIFLNVDIENTTPDYSNEIQGNPVFLTQQVTTQVLVTNGGTAVIGGVLQTQNSLAIKQVPLLGSVPYLGNLFKNRAISTSTQELLFFLTPRIVET